MGTSDIKTLESTFSSPNEAGFPSELLELIKYTKWFNSDNGHFEYSQLQPLGLPKNIFTQLNLFFGQLDQLPPENFQAIRQTIIQNRSELRDAAKTNYETATDIVKQAFENEDDKTLVLPISVAELIADIDDSIELPNPDADKKVRIPLFWRNIVKVVAEVIEFVGSVATLYESLSKIILK